MSIRCFFAISFVVGLSGCASWNKPDSTFQLPAPQLSSDALICEVAFLQWDIHESDADQRFWQTVDEQFVPPEVRRRLAENGLRVGLISGQLPERVREKLGATGDPIAALTAQNLAPGTEMLSRRERLQCHDGVTELIEVLPQSPSSLVVLLNDEGRVRGEQFDQPRGFIALTPYAQADGRVRVELTPGVEFGPWRQRIIGHQGGLRYDQRRDERLFDSLTVNGHLDSGQILVVTSTDDEKGIGGRFFANRFSSSTERLFLLIRVSRQQGDDLFAPSAKFGELVTPQE
jgi:hypothetical protein